MYTKEQVTNLIKKVISTATVDKDIIIVNKLDYFKSEFFKKNLKLQKIKEKISYVKYPFIYSGLHSTESNLIIIFFNNCKTSLSATIRNKYTTYDVVNILRVLHHEIKHAMQAEVRYKQKLTTVGFIYEMEDILTDYNQQNYKLRHDDYFIEIEANVYATSKVSEFVNENHSDDESIIRHVEKLKNKYINKLHNYDFEHFFNEFIKCCDKNELYKLKKYRIVNILYKENGMLKDLDEILMNEEFNQLDLSVKTLILRSLIKNNNLNLNSCTKLNIDKKLTKKRR